MIKVRFLRQCSCDIGFVKPMEIREVDEKLAEDLGSKGVIEYVYEPVIEAPVVMYDDKSLKLRRKRSRG